MGRGCWIRASSFREFFQSYVNNITVLPFQNPWVAHACLTMSSSICQVSSASTMATFSHFLDPHKLLATPSRWVRLSREKPRTSPCVDLVSSKRYVGQDSPKCRDVSRCLRSTRLICVACSAERRTIPGPAYRAQPCRNEQKPFDMSILYDIIKMAGMITGVRERGLLRVARSSSE